MKTTRFKYLQLTSMLYVMFLLLTMMVENRIVMFGSVKILAGTLIIPLSYVMSDVITEVYGYREMRRLIWTSIFILYVAAIIVFVIRDLPAGQYLTKDRAYDTVFSNFLSDVVTYSIAAVFSIFVNSYILSRWKILVRGRLFWLRSLGSTAIGEAIFIITWGFLGFSTKFPLPTLLELMLASYICKIVYNLIAIVPTSIAVAVLKNSEGVDTYDYNVKFNPFSLTI